MQLMEQITTEANLYQAWRRVRANRGGPGMDAVSVADYEANLPANLGDLQRRLQDETYVPLPLRRATMPKKEGGARELAIPVVSDRVAQRAFVNVLEGVFEPIFLPCSFGYRPGLGVSDAVNAVLRYREQGMSWILDADVQRFFPSVDHRILMAQLRSRIDDRAVLRTIGLWLEAGALSEVGLAKPTLLSRTAAQVRAAAREALTGEREDLAFPVCNDDFEDEAESQSSRYARPPQPDLWRRFGTEAVRFAWDYRRVLLPLLATKGVIVGGGLSVAAIGAAAIGQHLLAGQEARRTGTSQGGPLSPLLSNVYLHAFDERMTRAGLRLVRYADDFVICCVSESRARQAQEIAATELARLRLSLNTDKTRIVSCADPMRFLGYEFDADGAFPVSDVGTPVLLEAAKRTATVGVASAKSAAQSGGIVARNGVKAAGRAASSVTQEISERWHEAHAPSGQRGKGGKR